VRSVAGGTLIGPNVRLYEDSGWLGLLELHAAAIIPRVAAAATHLRTSLRHGSLMSEP
jgi:hypothetical protein